MSFFDCCAEIQQVENGNVFSAAHIQLDPMEFVYNSSEINMTVMHTVSERLKQTPQVLLFRQIDQFSFDALLSMKDLNQLENTLANLKQSFVVNDVWIEPEIRIGICFCESYFSNAMAFYYARSSCYEIEDQSQIKTKLFDSEAKLLELNRKRQQKEIFQVISEERIVLFLQPKIDIKNLKIVGFEALARWQTEDGTIKTPDTFLPVVEGTDLELLLGLLVVKQATGILSKFKKLGIHLPLNINVSPRQLSDRNFAYFLAEQLTKYEIGRDMFGVEILENEAFLHLEYTRPIFEIYQAANIHISLDDFGTGYASLSHLVELPIKEVKIDRVFIKNSIEKPVYQSIVSGVVELAKELNLVVTVEGIETIQQHELVKSLGVDYAQGFLYQRPMSVDDFLVKFAQNNDGEYFIGW